MIKNYTILALIVLLIGSGVFIYFQNKQREQIIQRQQTEISVLRGEVLSYIDKAGKLQQQVEAHKVSISTLKSTLDMLEIDKKELKKQVGNLNNLLFIAKTELDKAGSGHVEVKWKTDTVTKEVIKYAYINFKDEFQTIDVNIVQDSAYFNYKVNPITLTHTAYQISPFFGKSKSVMDISIVPDMTVKNANVFVIEHKTPIYKNRWVYLGAGFLFGSWINR